MKGGLALRPQDVDHGIVDLDDVKGDLVPFAGLGDDLAACRPGGQP